MPKIEGVDAADVDALAVNNNLSDVASVVASRSNLGLGSIAVQNANNVTISGGSISGITSLGVNGIATISNALYVGGATQQGVFRVKAATDKNIMVHDHSTSGTITLSASNENNIALVGLEVRASALTLLPDGGITEFNNGGAYVNSGVISVGRGNDSDGVELWLCHGGYLGAYTRYRNIKIGDGRAGLVAEFTGSTKATNLYSTLGVTGTAKFAGSNFITGMGISVGGAVAVNSFISGAPQSHCLAMDLNPAVGNGECRFVGYGPDADTQPSYFQFLLQGWDGTPSTTTLTMSPTLATFGTAVSIPSTLDVTGAATFSNAEFNAGPRGSISSTIVNLSSANTVGSSTGIIISDTTSQAVGIGGGITFSYKYTDAGAYVNDAATIRASKENSTSGEFGTTLEFYTRPNGGASSLGMSISGENAVTIPGTLGVTGAATLGATQIHGATNFNIYNSHNSGQGRMSLRFANDANDTLVAGVIQSSNLSIEAPTYITGLIDVNGGATFRGNTFIKTTDGAGVVGSENTTSGEHIYMSSYGGVMSINTWDGVSGRKTIELNPNGGDVSTGGGLIVAGSTHLSSYIQLANISQPSQPTSSGRVYVGTDNKLYYLDASNTQYDLMSGGTTWAVPGTIGSTTPNTIAGTTGSFSGMVTGAAGYKMTGGHPGGYTANSAVIDAAAGSARHYTIGADAATRGTFLYQQCGVGAANLITSAQSDTNGRWSFPLGLNGTMIGQITPAAGTFTTLIASTGQFGGSTNSGVIAARGGTDENFIVGGHILVSGAVSLSAGNNADTANVPFEYRATSHTWVDAGVIKMDLTGGNLTVVGTGTFNGATQNTGVGASFKDGISVAHRGAQVAVASSAILDYNPDTNEGGRLMLFGPDNSTYSGEFSLRFMYANSGSSLSPLRVSPTSVTITGTSTISSTLGVTGVITATSGIVGSGLSWFRNAASWYGAIIGGDGGTDVVALGNWSGNGGGAFIVGQISNLTNWAPLHIGHSSVTTTIESPLTVKGAATYEQMIKSTLVATTNQAGFRSESTFPRISIYKTDAGTDAKHWDIIAATANQIAFRLVNDADSSGVNWLTVNRTGMTPTTAILSTDTMVDTAGGTSNLGVRNSTATENVQMIMTTYGGITSIDGWDYDAVGRSEININQWGGGCHVGGDLRVSGNEKLTGTEIRLNTSLSTTESFVGTSWFDSAIVPGSSGGAHISFTRINAGAGPVGGDYIRIYTHRQSVSHAQCGLIDENGTWTIGRGTQSLGPSPGSTGSPATLILTGRHSTPTIPTLWFDTGTNGQGCAIENSGGNLDFYKGGNTAWNKMMSVLAAGAVWINQRLEIYTPNTSSFEMLNMTTGAGCNGYVTMGRNGSTALGRAAFFGFNDTTSKLYFGMHTAGNALEIDTSRTVTIIKNMVVNGQAYSATNTLSDAASIATDCDTGNVHTVTLAGNRTLANPTNLKDGATYVWIVKQDATGTRTLAYGSAFKFPLGITPILSTTANAVDIISGVSDGTNVYCSIQLLMS